MGKIISVFSHKGGVGKTTFVFNLAYQLSSMGKKVLLIDTDAQMNLTSSVYGMSNSVEYLTEHGTEWMGKLKKNKNFYDFLKEYGVLPKQDNDNINKPIFSRNLQEAITLQKSLPLFANIDLISSSIDVIEAENKLYNFEGTEDRPAKFQNALRDVAKKYDFVLIDTSPSAGSTINGLTIVSSDYFISVANPTFFSLQAMDNMRYIFAEWSKKLQIPSSQYGFKRDVKFLGIVFQMAKRFKIKKNNNGEEIVEKEEDSKFAEHAEGWMNQINKSITRFQVEAQRDKWAIDEISFVEKFGNMHNAFVIEKCCDFTGKLRTIAEEFGVPILALDEIITDDKKNLSQTINLDQYRKVLDMTKESYTNIANGLIKL
jgi:chromosome partitioning protein